MPLRPLFNAILDRSLNPTDPLGYTVAGGGVQGAETLQAVVLAEEFPETLKPPQ